MITKNDTLENLLKTVILLVAVGLSYAGDLAWNQPQATIYGRALAVPMMASIYVFSPDLTPGYQFIGWAGSIVCYAAVGFALLVIATKWIKARNDKKNKDKNNRI